MTSSSSTSGRLPHGPSTTVRAALPRPYTLVSNIPLDMPKLLRCVFDQPDFTGVTFYDNTAERTERCPLTEADKVWCRRSQTRVSDRISLRTAAGSNEATPLK